MDFLLKDCTKRSIHVRTKSIKKVEKSYKKLFIIFTERRHQKHHSHAMKTLKDNEALFRFHTAFVLKKFVP